MAEHELYYQHSSVTFEAELSKRKASHAAGFLLPHLRPGMNVLDAGCGPGSITMGLAAVVAPGEVVGIDIQLSQVEQARTLAAERGVTNVRFEASNIYELPFPDGSFDVALPESGTSTVVVFSWPQSRRCCSRGSVCGRELGNTTGRILP